MGEITKITNGESGAVVANKLWAVNKFDFVVENQADMDTLASYTGGAYKNILIKASVSTGVSLTRENIGFKKIVCESGVVITGEDIVSAATSGGLFDGGTATDDDLFIGGSIELTMNNGEAGVYTAIANMNNIHNIHINADPYEDDTLHYTGLLNCNNVYNVKVTQDNSGGDSYCFQGCHGLFNCSGHSLEYSGYDGYDFYQCTGVVFPTSLGGGYFQTAGTLANTTLS